MGRIHGSNPWVGGKNVAGQGDAIRNMTCSQGSFEAWRVGSGQKVYKVSRARSGRVGPEASRNTTGRIGSPDPTRPARFDLTREKPAYFGFRCVTRTALFFAPGTLIPGVSFAFFCSFGIDFGLHSLCHSRTCEYFCDILFLVLDWVWQ